MWIAANITFWGPDPCVGTAFCFHPTLFSDAFMFITQSFYDRKLWFSESNLAICVWVKIKDDYFEILVIWPSTAFTVKPTPRSKNENSIKL